MNKDSDKNNNDNKEENIEKSKINKESNIFNKYNIILFILILLPVVLIIFAFLSSSTINFNNIFIESGFAIIKNYSFQAILLLIVDIYFGYFFIKLLKDTKKHSYDSYIGIIIISYIMMGILNVFSLLFIIDIL